MGLNVPQKGPTNLKPFPVKAVVNDKFPKFKNLTKTSTTPGKKS